MTVIFDTHAGEVYIENPDPRADGTNYARIFYYKPEGEVSEKDRTVVKQLRDLYNLGRQHKSQEIRKVLGVYNA